MGSQNASSDPYASSSPASMYSVTLGPEGKGPASTFSCVTCLPTAKLVAPLSVQGEWIVDGTAEILWLPVDYRPTCEAARLDIIVLGHVSGAVSFLHNKEGPKFVK